MLATVRRGLAGVLVAVACATLASCIPAQGNGPHDKAIAANGSKPSPLDALSASEVLAVAQVAVMHARGGSVTLPAAEGDSVAPVSLTVDVDGDRELWTRLRGGEPRLRVVDGQGYVSGAYPLPGRLVPIPEGRWVRVEPGTDPLAEIRRLTQGRAAGTLTQMVDGVLGAGPLPVALSGRSDYGVQTVAVVVGEGADGRVVHVAAHGTHGPVAVVAGTGELLLEATWDEPLQVEGPSTDSMVAFRSVVGVSDLPGA